MKKLIPMKRECNVLKTGPRDVPVELRFSGCRFSGCIRKHHALGLCRGHYMQQWMGRPLGLLRRLSPKERGCSVQDCPRSHYGEGLCGTHYRAKNREKEKARRRRYYIQNHATVLERASQYRAENREKIREGALRGCTNRYYAGGTSRATVDGKITMDALRAITSQLKLNHADFITSVVKAGPMFNTAPVEPSFVVYVGPTGENDVRNLPGFTKVVEYGGSTTPFHPLEIGAVDNFRFIVGPELATIPNAGAAVGTTGLYSTGGTYIDVVPFIIVGADAWGDVALKGMRAAKITHLKPGQIDKSDVLGLKGYCGAMFPSAMFVQNDGWMAILEAGRTALNA